MNDKIYKLTFVLMLLTSMVFANESSKIIIIFTDLSIQGQVSDIKKPHIDQLAKGGIIAFFGYVTAPKYTPTRTGLFSARYQELLRLEKDLQLLRGRSPE